MNFAGWLKQILKRLAASMVFYTIVPVPRHWNLDFQAVARFAPVMGLLIGGALALLDQGLHFLLVPTFTRSVLIVLLWVWLTGGLHLDGAMDTADGLAVQQPERRLQVMADSVTGAFGAIVAVLLLLLKTATLADLESWRWLSLMLAAGWGRWGQLVAIARYLYLKPTGKGAFHKTAIRSVREAVPSGVLLLGLSAVPLWQGREFWLMTVSLGVGGGAIALLTGTWFAHKLGGHTGDTYGATVEWTEALFLTLLVVAQGLVSKLQPEL